MNQQIKTPCSKCGGEAETPTGCLFIGKSFFDPEAKPVCSPCHKQWQQAMKNKILKFTMVEDANNTCICSECGGLVSVGLAGKHATDVHNMRRYEFVRNN